MEQSDLVADQEPARRTGDRRWAELQAVQRSRRMSVAELSRQFGVSEVSIRRDLACLAEMGLLRRVHGGAQALVRSERNSVFDARRLLNTEAKRALGQAAATLIRPGDTILLDSGTTMLEIARHIPRALLDGGDLTVICRSLVIASELRSQRQARLLVLGGVYQHDYDAFVGAELESALAGLHAHIFFLGTDGVSADRGLATDNVLEAQLYRTMARLADRVVVVTDSSKIGRRRLQATLGFGEIHTFVTDSNAPEDFVALLREQGVEVILVPPSKC